MGITIIFSARSTKIEITYWNETKLCIVSFYNYDNIVILVCLLLLLFHLYWYIIIIYLYECPSYNHHIVMIIIIKSYSKRCFLLHNDDRIGMVHRDCN